MLYQRIFLNLPLDSILLHMMTRKLFQIAVICSTLNMFAQASPQGSSAPKTANKQEVAPVSKTKDAKIKVTGKIKNEAGDDIVGANVSVQGKDISVVSDATGQFTILVVATDVLVISSLGMEDVVLPVEGKKRIYINMVPRKGEKYGIFTALGIEKEEEKTNVAYEQVSGDNVELGRDALDGVEGITPGLDVVYASSMPGASAKATIRGGSSPFNNEPLIVVDGVPINTLSFGSQEGVDQSYRIFDINPQDVQMVTVLKGAAATALYGSRGGNGAILYTTRRGKNGKLDITYNTYFRADFARALPEKQTKYSFNEKDANAYSWGEILANTPADLLNAGFGKEAYDQYGTFFKPGLSHSHNLSIAGGKGRFKTFSSVNITRGETSMLQGLTYQKLNLRFNGSSELSDKVSVDFSTAINNYQGDKSYKGGGVLNPEGNGVATLFGGITHALYLLPINLYVGNDGNPFSEAVQPLIGFDNPYWSLKNVIYTENTSHFMGSLKFSYDLNGNKKKEENAFRFDMMQRIGVDYSGTTLKQSVKRAASNFYQRGRVGGIFSDNLRFMHDLIFNAVKRFENRSSIKISAGILFSGNNMNSTNTMGTGIIGTPATITQVEKSITNDLIVEQYDAGLMFNVEYNYKKVISAALGIRQDFLFESAYAGSYALPYPVLDFGFVFTELSKQAGNKGFGGLTYGKMRASFGASGNAPTPYYYNYVSRALDVALASNDANVGNPNVSLYAPGINGADHPFMDVVFAKSLRPEYKLGADVGFDFGFLKDRVLLKMGYFFEMLNGGILSTYVDESTLLFSNAMNMTTQGAELSLYSKPVVSKNFEWNLDVHASFSRSMVSSVSVDDGSGNVNEGVYSISGIQNPDGNKLGSVGNTTNGFTLYNAVAAGAAFGSFYGTYWDENREKQAGIIGDPNPWVRMGLQNKLSFYGVELSFLVNFRIGGDVWNGTSQKMNYYGVGVETANREEIGNVPVEDPSGIGASDWASVSKQYWQDVMGSVADGGIEKNIHSIKLKDVTIAYNYKNKKEIGLKGWQIYVKLRDMYTWSTLSNGLDPDTFLGGSGSHTYGTHYFNNPQSRAIIAGMKFTF